MNVPLTNVSKRVKMYTRLKHNLRRSTAGNSRGFTGKGVAKSTPLPDYVFQRYLYVFIINLFSENVNRI